MGQVFVFKKIPVRSGHLNEENAENHQGPVLYFLGNLKNRLGPGFRNRKEGSSEEGAVST